MSCPYCGSNDLRPLQDRFGRFQCGECQRRFVGTLPPPEAPQSNAETSPPPQSPKRKR